MHTRVHEGHLFPAQGHTAHTVYTGVSAPTRLPGHFWAHTRPASPEHVHPPLSVPGARVATVAHTHRGTLGGGTGARSPSQCTPNSTRVSLSRAPHIRLRPPGHRAGAAPGSDQLPSGPAWLLRRVLVPSIPAKDRPAAGPHPAAVPASDGTRQPCRLDETGMGGRAGPPPWAKPPLPRAPSLRLEAPSRTIGPRYRTGERTEPGRAPGRAPDRATPSSSSSAPGGPSARRTTAASQPAPADGRRLLHPPESPAPTKGTAGESRAWAGAEGSPGTGEKSGVPGAGMGMGESGPCGTGCRFTPRLEGCGGLQIGKNIFIEKN